MAVVTTVSPRLQLAAAAELELRRRRRERMAWPAIYTNSDTGHTYEPHTEEERLAVYLDKPRYVLLKGGEGSGKSVAGIIKTLHKLRRGCTGIMVSPDFEHFKRSLWPEFRRWCPWNTVLDKQYMAQKTWEPSRPFSISFQSEVGGISQLLCGGIEDPTAWEGPNVNFAMVDEAHRKRDATALKILDGRCRILGPHGEAPQLYFPTTPRKHWLFDYFGPVRTDKPDPFLSFKKDSRVVTLRTTDNAKHLSDEFADKRRQSLTESEARVYLDAEWADMDDDTHFLPTMLWWDACYDSAIPILDRRTPLVIALDAGVSGDCFAMVGVSRHSDRYLAETDIVVRYLRLWEPHGVALDYGPIEQELKELCETFNVVCVTYDPYQLHSTATRLEQANIAWFAPFTQDAPRLIADKQLLDLILAKRIHHDGNDDLRQHIENANRKSDSRDKERLRIVKRSQDLKIDLAVALSMASAKCLELNL